MSKADALKKFEDFCRAEFATMDPDDKFDSSDEQDWFSLSLGFFAALGFTAEDSHELALLARYTYHYWC